MTDVGPDGVTFFYTYRPITADDTAEADQHGRHPAVSDAEAAVAF